MVVVYASYSLRIEEAVKESVVRERKLAVELVADGESMAIANEIYKKQSHV